MSDPLSDPRAADLLSADPGEVWTLASTFHRVASEAQTVATGLRGARNDATWTGAAATAFRGKLGKLPGDLDRVQKSYQEVADALNAYEGELATIKPAFQRVASQLGTARSGLAGAQGSLSSAESHLTTVAGAGHPNQQAVHSAQSAVNLANGTVTRMQGEVNGLETQGMQLLDRFDTARRTCQQHVSSACSIPPHQSWLDAALHDIGNFMSGAGHFLAGIAKGVWDGVTGLPSALVDFVEHPSFKTFAKLAEDVAITAGVVLLATGAGEVLLGAAGLGDAAAAEGLSTVAEGAETAAKAASVGGAGGEAGQGIVELAHGDGRQALSDFAHGGLDGLVALTPGAGNALSSVRTAASAERVAGIVGDYAKAVDGGAVPYDELMGLDPSERAVVLDQAIKSARPAATPFGLLLATMDRLNHPEPMSVATEAVAKDLHIHSLPAKIFVNAGAEHLVIDPLKDQGTGRIDNSLGVCTEG